VELCQAQNWRPKPDELFPCAVAITYWVEAFEEPLVLPKCRAARTASEASCDCLGFEGAVEPLSYQVPARMALGFPAWREKLCRMLTLKQAQAQELAYKRRYDRRLSPRG